MTDELPEGNRNIAPSDDWVETKTIVTPSDAGRVSVTHPSRWMLHRTGEVVMWGEGKITLNWARMAHHDHDVGGYVLRVGGAVGDGAVPNAEGKGYPVETPDSVRVGTVRGEVSQKAEPEFSPDIRAVKE